MEKEQNLHPTLSRQDTGDDLEELPSDQVGQEPPSTSIHETAITEQPHAPPTDDAGTSSPAPKRKACRPPTSILIRMLTSGSSDYETLYDDINKDNLANDETDETVQSSQLLKNSRRESDSEESSSKSRENKSSQTDKVSSRVDPESSNVESGASGFESDSSKKEKSKKKKEKSSKGKTDSADKGKGTASSEKVTAEQGASSSGKTTKDVGTDPMTDDHLPVYRDSQGHRIIFSLDSDLSPPRDEESSTGSSQEISSQCDVNCFCFQCKKK